MKANRRIKSVDFFRLISILFVIIIHTTPFGDLDFQFYKYFYITLNQAARFAVPFFFVISGFFYGSKIHHNFVNPRSYTFLRLINFFLLWIIWSFLYILPYNIHSTLHYGFLGPIKIAYWNLLNLLSNPEKLF